MKILVTGGTGKVGAQAVKGCRSARQIFACLYARKALRRRRGFPLALFRAVHDQHWVRQSKGPGGAVERRCRLIPHLPIALIEQSPTRARSLNSGRQALFGSSKVS